MPCGVALELGWIPVRKTVRRDDEVHESDHVTIEAKLLPILDRERQDTILREELEQRGWTRHPDGSLTKVFGEALATLPAQSSTITLEVAAKQAVSAEATETGRAPEEDVAAQDAIGARAAAKADAQLARAREDARTELILQNIRKIERVQEDVQREVSDSVNATTKRSLQQRAAELGAIESIQEGRDRDGGYELTITVKT